MVTNKQTAVEWLEQEFIALQNYGVNELGLFHKAKLMERYQMIDFADKVSLERLNDSIYSPFNINKGFIIRKLKIRHK